MIVVSYSEDKDKYSFKPHPKGGTTRWATHEELQMLFVSAEAEAEANVVDAEAAEKLRAAEAKGEAARVEVTRLQGVVREMQHAETRRNEAHGKAIEKLKREMQEKMEDAIRLALRAREPEGAEEGPRGGHRGRRDREEEGEVGSSETHTGGVRRHGRCEETGEE